MRRLIAAFQEGLVVLVLIALTGAGAFSLRTLINHESTADSATPPAGSILAEASFPVEEPVILPADSGSEQERVTAPALLPPMDAAFLPQTIPAPEPPPSIRLISEATEPEMAETFSTAQQTTRPPETGIELPQGWILLNPHDSLAGDSILNLYGNPGRGSLEESPSDIATPENSWIRLPEPFASLPVTRNFSQLDEPQSGGPRFPTDPGAVPAGVQPRGPAFGLPELLSSAAAAASAALNNTGQTQPSPFYLQDDIQYVPPGHVRMVAGTDEQETRAAAPPSSEPSVSNPS
ncbi:MAG: hypothetical protein KDA79_08320, partial [Planctomycetaceae bacterium]|nr:hypothetical protein [Planctomycetaceae bacterium]